MVHLSIRSLMNDKKDFLKYKCKRSGLSTYGTKAQLAVRFATFKAQELTKAWKVISESYEEEKRR